MKTIHSREEFDLLTIYAQADESMGKTKLHEQIGDSLDADNSVAKELADAGLIHEGDLTPKGIEALEPYRVRRAVFMAAGFGSRLAPVTLSTPKPLVRVHGKRLIDRSIDACLNAGIDEIYIVRGYLAEQFDALLPKYPMLKFLENTAYESTNNISSAMCARHLLRNAYIFDADLLIRNSAIVSKYQYTTNYLGIPREHTDDWCFTVRGNIVEDMKIGGINCYQTVGVSYWDDETGRSLAGHIEQTYSTPRGKKKYWEEVPFLDFAEEYSVEVRSCGEEDVVEIDTIDELKAIDKAYETENWQETPQHETNTKNDSSALRGTDTVAAITGLQQRGEQR